MLSFIAGRTDTLTSCGIKGWGRFKAYKAAFCVDSCNRGCAGARANVRNQLAWAGIGADQILAELHGFLRWMDAAGHRKHKKHISGIAGVSHDIRTPLSMVMGYAGQLENSPSLSETERKKATVIVKQSERMKNLINNLNLASKLEYNMQPIMKKEEYAVAVVRQVVVDFMNMDIDDRFPIKWKTDDKLTVCNINADKDLLKRAISNLIQNSITHNENGCAIYVSVSTYNNKCIICVEDNGIGVSDEQIEKLNHTPHYMVCDTNTTEQRHGLGLLIVKQIMDGHSGTVIIEHSEYYGGFKTELTIPL